MEGNLQLVKEEDVRTPGSGMPQLSAPNLRWAVSGIPPPALGPTAYVTGSPANENRARTARSANGARAGDLKGPQRGPGLAGSVVCPQPGGGCATGAR